MLTPDPKLPLSGLTKARQNYRCSTPSCGRTIERGEFFLKYHQNGLQRDCIVCVTKDQIFEYESRIRDLQNWLKINGYPRRKDEDERGKAARFRIT